MPRVSVITPCYNAEKYVGQTIESICSQSFGDWEHILVNDGSTDGSAAVMRSFAAKDRRIRILTQSNSGMSISRNNGVRAASPESAYLLFLDADDCAEPGMLDYLVKYLDTHPDVGVARVEYRFIDAAGNFIEYDESKYRLAPDGLWLRELPPNCPDTPFLSVFTLCAIISSISLIRRSVFEQVGGYDETFGDHREDTDLFLRMALQSKIHFIPQKFIRRRRHPDQDTARSEKFQEKRRRQTQKLYTKWRAGEGLTEEQRGMVREAWRFKQTRVEPFFAFLKARKYFYEKNYAGALRYFIGGLRRYLASFVPGLDAFL